MKKAISLLLMLLMIVSIIPFAFAEEIDTAEADSEEETQNQIALMGTGTGAEVRLLQLEKAITENIIRGQEVIAEVESKGNDTSILEDLISDMEDLKSRVQALDAESEEAVDEFVALKAEAIELSKQFRDEAKTLLDKSDADALRTRLKEMNRSEITQLNNQIRNRIREYNAEQVKNLFGILGIENEELLANFSNGNSTLKEVRDVIKTEFKSMTQEEKKSAFSELKEAGVKKVITAKAVMEKVRERVQNIREKISNYRTNQTGYEDSGNDGSGQENEENSSNGRRGGNQ